MNLMAGSPSGAARGPAGKCSSANMHASTTVRRFAGGARRASSSIACVASNVGSACEQRALEATSGER